MNQSPIVLYGSYGYTGKLIAHECTLKNLNILLAGRNAAALHLQSKETGFAFEVVDIDDGDAPTLHFDISIALHIDELPGKRRSRHRKQSRDHFLGNRQFEVPVIRAGPGMPALERALRQLLLLIEIKNIKCDFLAKGLL